MTRVCDHGVHALVFRRFFPTELIGEEAYCYSGAAEIG